MEKSIQNTALNCPLDRIGLCETCLHTVRSVLISCRGAGCLCLEVLDNCRAGLEGGGGFGNGTGRVDAVESPVTGAARSKSIGLCGNCALDETCTRPRPESGVWHCEDYR